MKTLHREADMRFTVVRIRENAGIATSLALSWRLTSSLASLAYCWHLAVSLAHSCYLAVSLAWSQNQLLFITAKNKKKTTLNIASIFWYSQANSVCLYH